MVIAEQWRYPKKVSAVRIKKKVLLEKFEGNGNLSDKTQKTEVVERAHYNVAL